MSYRTATLTGFQDLSAAIRSFRFRVADQQAIEFIPGQWMSVSLPDPANPIVRAYSIAAVPNPYEFEICLNLVEEGKLSPRLFGLAPGDQISFRGPLGDFVYRKNGKSALFVATGTGIVPFRAMLSTGLPLEDAPQMTLLQGARHEDNLIYRAEFEQLQAANSNFAYLPTLTRPGSAWTGMIGRVQPFVYDYVAQNPEAQVYLCGLREMVDEIRKELIARGMSKQQIFFERYN
jgi:ferredoxin-NADP reductase